MFDHPLTLADVDKAIGLTSVGGGVTAVRRLLGGTHASTWLVEIADAGVEAVLREFPAGDTSADWEAKVLTALDGLDGLAPRLLAHGASSSSPVGSWLLISRLPGGADITSQDPNIVAQKLGEALAQVHAVPLGRLGGLRNRVNLHGRSVPPPLSGPASSFVLARWEQITAAEPVLIHRDFWSGNVVWQGLDLSGIVDWNGGALGPRGFDVGWCRLDLYLLYDEHTADEFLESYERASGAVLADGRIWDLWAVAHSDEAVETWVPNYHDLGRVDLTAKRLRERHTQWTELCMAAL